MIALLTDFGTDNHYVAQMKARILADHENAVLVDITHSIAPQNIVEAAFILRDSIEAFPAGTVFLTVVDPGVGTERRILIVECNQQFFVMPDNGLIDIVGRRVGIEKVYSVETQRFDASFTFHGRDIMAPIAGKIDQGKEAGAVARLILQEDIVRLAIEEPERQANSSGGGSIAGQIVYSDRFGNLITNIESSWLPADRSGCEVSVKDKTIFGIQNTFADAPNGELMALVGSHNRLEVAVNCGNAHGWVDCKLPQDVRVAW